MGATAQEEGIELVAVALNTDADGRWLDTTGLLEYGFGKYRSGDRPYPNSNAPRIRSVPVVAA